MCSAAGARGSMALRSSFIVWLRYIAVRLCCQGRVLLRGSTLVLAAMENSSGSPKAFLENGQPPVEVGRLPVSARELAAGAAILHATQAPRADLCPGCPRTRPYSNLLTRRKGVWEYLRPKGSVSSDKCARRLCGSQTPRSQNC